MREIKERAVLFLEAMLEDGGYFAAVEEAYFVDSGIYPETHDDGIARKSDGGVAAGTIVPRAADYLAPVCHHFGENHLPEGYDAEGGPAAGEAAKPCDLIGGCTLCDADKVPFIDELDPEDNVNVRLAQTAELREKGLIKPEVEWAADGWVVVTHVPAGGAARRGVRGARVRQGHEPAGAARSSTSRSCIRPRAR